MTTHLSLLREMFPGCLLLDVEQVASVLCKSPFTISDWYYKERLPFKVVPDPNGFKVSIIELANYLDSCLTGADGFKPSRASKQQAMIDMPVIKPPKIGRPRGTRKYDALFKSQLSFAVMGQLAQNQLQEIESAVSNFEVSVEDSEVVEAVNNTKNDLLLAIGKAKTTLLHTYLNLSLKGGDKVVQKQKTKI